MSDFNKPVAADAYADILPGLVTLHHNLAKDLDPATAGAQTNLPTNARCWNSANNRWEKWNGSAWIEASTLYAISISGTAGGVAWSNVSGKPTITAFIESLLNDSDASAARSTLGAAASGSNSDITSLSGLTSLLVTGARPFNVDTSTGDARMKGSAGGWAMSYGFKGSADTVRGGFGAQGDTDTLTDFWIGPAYNTRWATVNSNGVESGRFLGTLPLASGDVLGVGAGGTVTQTGVITNAVTIHKPTGRIDTVSHSYVSGVHAVFQVVNSTVGPNDVVSANVLYDSGSGNPEVYTVTPFQCGSGYFKLSIVQREGITKTGQLGIVFEVRKGATA
jgi:hypothetical protein